MEIPPLHSRVSSTASWAVSKTRDAWVNMPKALKLPFIAAAILYVPKDWVKVKGALLAATVLAETPRNLTAFLSNHPLQYFGKRWQLFDFFPKDPKAALTTLDKKIGTFERAQPPLFNPPLPLKMIDVPPISSAPTIDMAKATDKKLEILIEKVSYFSILKAMQTYSGVLESNTSSLLCLVDEASRSRNPALWNIFTRHYGAKMSLWGRLKAGFIYCFLWQFQILPKTVDAYLKNMLTELRLNLKDNGEKRKKFINGIFEDADNFFDVYNGAAETYAKDYARKGNLNHYRKTAIDLMLPKEGSKSWKTPEQLRMDLFRKLSASIVDHFSPKVRFGYLDGWLNNAIRNTLRDKILPEVFLAISEEGQEATKRHNIPFFLGLTKTLTAQISKVQGKIEEGPSSDTSSLYGIKNFEAIVKKVLWTLDMANCKTADEVRARIEKLKTPWSGLDGEVRNGIQLGIQKGLAVLCDYLSKQENTEELFANLFESITSPLSGSGKLPMDDKEWSEMAIEYEGAKILLKQAGAELSKQIIQSAIQDKVGGGKVTEAAEKAARAIFSEHKARGRDTFEELLRICKTIRKKLHPLNDVSEINIYSELASIASILKAFENKERVKITIEQDPPPKIATLPHSEQEAILRILHPLYEGANQIMDHVLDLQNLQKQCTSRLEMQQRGDRLLADARKFYELIERAKKETLLQPTSEELGQVGGTLGFLFGLGIGKYSPEAATALGAAAATGVANLSNLAKGKWLKFTASAIGASAVSIFATKYLSDTAAAFGLPPIVPALIGAAGTTAGFEYVGAKFSKRLVDTGVEVVMPKVTEIFDTAYEHLLTNDLVINGGIKIMMKQVVDLFPPKK
jgi:hypothetical protein